MHDPLLVALLICAIIGSLGELSVIILPVQVLSLLDRPMHDTTPLPKASLLLGVLSIFSVLTVILLFVSGEPKFRIYGIILLLLPLVVWILKKKIKSVKYLIVAESTVCIIILLDTIRTISQLHGWL